MTITEKRFAFGAFLVWLLWRSAEETNVIIDITEPGFEDLPVQHQPDFSSGVAYL